MFKTFSLTVFEHTNDPGRTQKRGRMTSYDNRVFGHFMFLLRCIMIRHSHAQTYRGTSTTLMSLPPKVRAHLSKVRLMGLDNVTPSSIFVVAVPFPSRPNGQWK